jgi:hypothetical protein
MLKVLYGMLVPYLISLALLRRMATMAKTEDEILAELA